MRRPATPTLLLLTAALLAPPAVTAAQAPAAEARPAYATQTWPKTRTLVWGIQGKYDKRKIDVKSPANWLEDGKPAERFADKDTDLVVPAGCMAAWVGEFSCRHLTLEKGASFSQPKVKLNVHGNLHLHEGASMYFQPLVFKGDQHTFVRNDNPPDAKNLVLGPWILVEKGRGASVEFLGNVASNDEFKFNEGLAIVGPGARVTAGPASIQIIGPEAILEIQSGGVFEKRSNASHDNPDILVQGELRGGSPQRPLTADAFVGLSVKHNLVQERGFKASTGSNYARGPNQYTSQYIGQGLDSVGLLVEPQGRLRVHTQDPAKARLVVRHHGHAGRRSGGEGDPATQPAAAPDGLIAAALLGSADLNGVLLDHFKAGGIRLPDPSSWRRFPRLAFGPHNQGPPDQLFAAWPRPPAPPAP